MLGYPFIKNLGIKVIKEGFSELAKEPFQS